MITLKKTDICSCGSSELEQGIYRFNHNGVHFKFRQCRTCKKFLLDPCPSEEQFGDCFSQDYFGKSEESKFISPGERFIDYFRSKRARYVKSLIGDKGNVLDFGCGSGQFLAKLNSQGYNCYGTELSVETAKRALKIRGINVHVGKITEKTFNNGMFEIASLCHVLDHLYNPDESISYISKWLKPNGILMISVPNMDSWQSKIFKGEWFGTDPLRTFRHYNLESMDYMLGKNDLKIIEVSHLSWEQNLYWILQSILHKFGFKRNDFYELIKGNRKFNLLTDALQIIIILIFLLPSAVFTVLEALFKHGGSLEIIAKKA